MTLEHSIRMAVRGLAGKPREDAILELRKRPYKIAKVQKLLLASSDKRRKRILGVYKDKYPIPFCVRLTAEQYLELKASATALGVSISRLTRARLCKT